VLVKCQECGTYFERYPADIKSGIFCSKKCWYLSNRVKNEYDTIDKNTAKLIIKRKKETHEVLIDLEDVEKISEYLWNVDYSKKNLANKNFHNEPRIFSQLYEERNAKTNGYPKISLQRFIMGIHEKFEEKIIIYKNGNRLDLRKENLVIADTLYRMQNRSKKAQRNNLSTGIRNVYIKNGKYRIEISCKLPNGLRKRFYDYATTLKEAEEKAKILRANVHEMSSEALSI